MALIVVLVLSGCAGVSFYKTSDLKERTGIPVYGSKPYLLVSRTGSKDKPVEVSIVYLTHRDDKIYARPRSGFGSAKLSLALSNGQLTSFGQETDTKIPETITSLAGMLTAQAGAGKTAAEAAAIRAGIDSEQSGVDLTDVGEKVSTIAAEMFEQADKKQLKGLTTPEYDTLKRVSHALSGAGAILSNPTVPNAAAQLDTVKAQVTILKEKFPVGSTSTDRDQSFQIVNSWVKSLSELYDSVQPKPPAQPTFELYEIITTDGSQELRRVNVR
ncbi:hypothetical protein [Luteimonas saliphila]|uniref:hypothetical protein n=1 Tax=Luteimonas saliphila TaxID=2804919 RepID=UPI00192E11E6|nr:hypothetical protein [Luteimonas saliphila]